MEKLNRKNFKAIMNALAMPGSIKKITSLHDSGLLAIANLLLYSEVSFFYDGKEDITLVEAINYPKKEEVECADYIFSDKIDLELLKSAKNGDYANPDFSATLIFGCKNFYKTKVILSGPGIDGKKEAMLPCDKEFIKQLKEKNSNYPLGVEVYFLNDKNQILVLSRTTEIEVL